MMSVTNLGVRMATTDARWWQIGFLGSFLTLGFVQLGLTTSLGFVAGVVFGTLGVQALAHRLLRISVRDYRSALVTCCGLVLLLRSETWWVGVVVGALATGSKFTLRWRGRHIFNPANFGVAAALLFGLPCWLSPSQWGENVGQLAWFVILGLAVTHRAFRQDISLSFLTAWITLKASRVVYLGQRWQVLGHQLNVGSLIIFAFFMISDPKTTPRTVLGRTLYAALVASLAFVFQHQYWLNNSALIYALFVLSPVVPLIDTWCGGEVFDWDATRRSDAASIPSGSAYSG